MIQQTKLTIKKILFLSQKFLTSDNTVAFFLNNQIICWFKSKEKERPPCIKSKASQNFLDLVLMSRTRFSNYSIFDDLL